MMVQIWVGKPTKLEVQHEEIQQLKVEVERLRALVSEVAHYAIQTDEAASDVYNALSGSAKKVIQKAHHTKGKPSSGND